jgi:peptidoglycan/xylan/chitin deacetylase (PgdA/CDA1 family)
MKLLSFLALTLAVNICIAQKLKSPETGKATIVLTYDDALQSQLKNVVPVLNEAKLKATFFLDGRFSHEQMKLWKAAANAGHEIANHSLYHPCSRQTLTDLQPQYQSENYDLNSIIKEIGMMNKLLFGIDGRVNRTYAFPCTETSVGGKDYREALKNSGLIKYARGGGDSNAVITDLIDLDFFNVPSWGISENTTGDQLISFVKKVVEAKGTGVLMFHGVGGDYLKVSAEAHNLLIKYLQQHKKEVQVRTFREAMEILAKQK